MSARRLALFVARRLLALVVLLLVLSFAIFSLLALAPGSPERSLLGTRPATPETLAEIRSQYNLDKPFLTQYAIWLKNATRLDFGESIQNQQRVKDLLEQRVGVSLRLIGLAFAIAVVFGVALGVAAAVRAETILDRSIVAATIVGVSAPAFVSGLILLYVFALQLGWFPAVGASGNLGDYVLPAVALALGMMALITRVARAGMRRELSRDHLTFARARGLSRAHVLLVHGVRNALIPVLTSAGLVFSLMLGGSLLVETVFSLQGVGSLLVGATLTSDFPVVQGLALLLAVVIVVMNLLVDLSYLLLDPRVRFERARA
ncbi:MAG: ABC transporter permease [Actinomycetota bacterium]|nr:ABC transporter permease [Actinomycetota bacterium]